MLHTWELLRPLQAQAQYLTVHRKLCMTLDVSGKSSLCYPRRLLLYWAIQAGLLTPLTFAQHRLSPLAAFTSGVYFLHNGRRRQ